MSQQSAGDAGSEEPDPSAEGDSPGETTGEPDDETTGDPDVGTAGDPDIGTTGSPDVGRTGVSDVGTSGVPDVGSATESGDESPSYTFDDVAVVMGTYNEEAAISTVLSDVESVTDGRASVVCVDGSDDRTPQIAREYGARVVEQEPQGYGVAVRAAILAAERPVIVTTDCDDTYPMESLPTFLDHVNDGADVVSGDRISGGTDAMPVLNRQGNRAFALLASLVMGRRVHDTTTGMRAYRREVVESIEWTENTGLSAELLMRPLMRGYDVREVRIPYSERRGDTKLDPFTGGAAIAKSIVRVGAAERLS